MLRFILFLIAHKCLFRFFKSLKFYRGLGVIRGIRWLRTKPKEDWISLAFSWDIEMFYLSNEKLEKLTKQTHFFRQEDVLIHFWRGINDVWLIKVL